MILADSRFNDPPPAGFDFSLVDLDPAHNDEESGTTSDLDIDGVADTNTCWRTGAGSTTAT